MKSPRIHYLKLPVAELPDLAVVRLNIRKHHWQRHWEAVRQGDKERAAYHRKLAQSVQVDRRAA